MTTGEKANAGVCSQGRYWGNVGSIPLAPPEKETSASQHCCLSVQSWSVSALAPYPCRLNIAASSTSGLCLPLWAESSHGIREVLGAESRDMRGRCSRWTFWNSTKVSLSSHWNCPLQSRLKSETRYMQPPQGVSYILIRKCVYGITNNTRQAYCCVLGNQWRTWYILSLLSESPQYGEREMKNRQLHDNILKWSTTK